MGTAIAGAFTAATSTPPDLADCFLTECHLKSPCSTHGTVALQWRRAGGFNPVPTREHSPIKRVLAALLVRSPFGAIWGTSSRLDSRPATEIESGLRVFAQPHDEVSRRWGRAIAILSMSRYTSPVDYFHFSIDGKLGTALRWVCYSLQPILKAHLKGNSARVPFRF